MIKQRGADRLFDRLLSILYLIESMSLTQKQGGLPEGYVDIATAAKLIALSGEADNIIRIELHIDSTVLTTCQKADLIAKILKAKFDIAFKGVGY